MKNLKELNSKDIGMLVVMCKADGTPIKMRNGAYIAVAYDSDKSNSENIAACKAFARENKIGEAALLNVKFKKMKETKLAESLEFMPNDKGNIKVKKVADGYKSNVTKDKSKHSVNDLEIKKYLKDPTPMEIGLAKAVLKDLKSKGKEGDVTKKCKLDPKPDVVPKGNGDVEINPDNGKASYILPAKELEKFEEDKEALDESMDTFDGVCPYCGNPVGLDTTECGYCGFDLSDYDECQISDVDYEGLSGKRFEESEEALAKNPFENFFKGYEMVIKGMKGLKEGELRAMNRNRALQLAKQNRMQGAAFSANTPMEIKKGLQMMKSQLQDMLANRGRYELALQQGFVIAGFGGNLGGIEVPETLMTGELPAGVTPEQAFDQVVDFMRKTIANLTIKLAKAGKDPTALPKQPTKYLESKNLREKIGVKGHYGVEVRLGNKNKSDNYLTQILGENGTPAKDAEPFEKATRKEVEESGVYKNAIKRYGKDNVTIVKF